MSFITINLGQFAYFDAELGRPDWRGKTILDFGGNTGNLLKDPNSTVEPRLYTCIDVSRDAIERGKAAHPEARFIFYDRYSFEFNPTGVPGLELPDVGVGFDYVLALSVFTHMSEQEMLWYVPRLRALLNEGGTLVFTILDPHHAPDESSATNLRYYGLRQHDGSAAGRDLREIESRLDSGEVRRGRWFTIVNEELYIEGDSPGLPPSRAARDRYITFYTPERIRALIPGVRVVPPAPAFPRQHCCLLQARTGGDSPRAVEDRCTERLIHTTKPRGSLKEAAPSADLRFPFCVD